MPTSVYCTPGVSYCTYTISNHKRQEWTICAWKAALPARAGGFLSPQMRLSKAVETLFEVVVRPFLNRSRSAAAGAHIHMKKIYGQRAGVARRKGRAPAG